MAEGVETAEPLSDLTAMKCDIAQGFYFAKPQAPAAMPSLVRTETRRNPPALRPAGPIGKVPSSGL